MSIVSNPDICGGEPRIAGTRIPVWLLVQAKNLGMSDKDLLNSFPSLNLEDLENAWKYYKSFKDEINKQIEENKKI